MAFQALLFCPDDKTARTVTQVLSELEFNVEPCTEPFAAVKKLMSDHFDALVVDCDNEQNATLLFKSARNSTSNQTSLAVAIVEGQAGVAKAFRIGANLVLTKPINVEQSKGTLRVARGLLRKGDPVKPGAPAPATTTASVPSTPIPPKPAAAKPVPPVRPAAPAAPVVSTSRPPIPPAAMPPQNVAAAQVAASSGLAEPDEVLDIKGTDSTRTAPTPIVPPALNKITPPASSAAKASPVSSGSSFGSGAASAPAPAREAQVQPADTISTSVTTKPPEPLEKTLAVDQSTTAAFATESAPAPSFTFGGANTTEQTDDGRKKIFIGIAAAVVVVGCLYAGWTHFKGNTTPVATSVPATVPATSTASATVNPKPTVPKPVAEPAPTTSTPTTPAAAQPVEATSQPATTGDNTEPAPEDSVASDSRTTTKPASSPSAAKSTASKSAPAPLVVKGGAAPAKKIAPANPDTQAPNVVAIVTPTSSGVLSNLVGSGTAPKPVLQSVNISQGVSQGLLVKRIQPVYPRTALSMRIEGIVELMATISKTGDITGVKVLKGDPQLTRAAADAVKQWKYKPYLLNGEPVEITTQVTVNFKLPN